MKRTETVLLYGATGSGKTGQLGEIAKWEFARTGRKTRLISADSGWETIEHLVVSPDNPDGIIEAYDIQYVSNPFATLHRLAEGYWPKVVGGKVLLVPPGPDEFAKIGQYFNEGLSTFSQLLLATHARKQTKLSQDVAYSYDETVDVVGADGKPAKERLSFAKASMSHFGDVQDRVLLDFVPMFAKLPVDRVIWTAHEARGDDNVTGVKKSVLGPATVGTAAVDRTIQRFGDTLHMVKIVDPKGLRPVERRAYFVDHPDEDLKTKSWQANARQRIDFTEKLYQAFPKGYVELAGSSKSLAAYFDLRFGGNETKPASGASK